MSGVASSPSTTTMTSYVLRVEVATHPTQVDRIEPFRCTRATRRLEMGVGQYPGSGKVLRVCNGPWEARSSGNPLGSALDTLPIVESMTSCTLPRQTRGLVGTLIVSRS